MARVTVEDCLNNVDNRFELVLLAAKRARKLANGASSIVNDQGDKPTVVALREIATGRITSAEIDAMDEQEGDANLVTAEMLWASPAHAEESTESHRTKGDSSIVVSEKPKKKATKSVKRSAVFSSQEDEELIQSLTNTSVADTSDLRGYEEVESPGGEDGG